MCLCAVLWLWLVCALQFGCAGIVLGAGGGCGVEWACVGGASSLACSRRAFTSSSCSLLLLQ